MNALLVAVKNPLDDISDKMHKDFMQEYLDKWPYVPKVQYCVGQNIYATFNGLLQACEVLITDSSLIQVVFEVGLACATVKTLSDMFHAECSCKLNFQLFVRCCVSVYQA